DFHVTGVQTCALPIYPYLTLVPAIPLGFIVGALMQKLVLTRVIDAKPETMMLATLGISLVIANLLLLTFGGEPKSVNVAYAASRSEERRVGRERSCTE